MIPKKIHYCWFGRGEKPKLTQKCIASWKKYCPDYEIIEWNEDNFDVKGNAYTRYCYENRKWAFLSDYVRLVVIGQQGGIYFDTDVEVVRSFDDLLKYGAFFGFENSSNVATGLGFGADEDHPITRQLMKEYEPLLDGLHGTQMCPALNTAALVKLGLKLNGRTQKLGNVFVGSQAFFNPYDDLSGKLSQTAETHSIHWYSKSWLSKGIILRSKLTQPFHGLFGKNCFDWLKKR